MTGLRWTTVVPFRRLERIREPPALENDDDEVALRIAESCWGNPRLTVQEIVDKTGISKSTLYRRFGSRPDSSEENN